MKNFWIETEGCPDFPSTPIPNPMPAPKKTPSKNKDCFGDAKISHSFLQMPKSVQERKLKMRESCRENSL